MAAKMGLPNKALDQDMYRRVGTQRKNSAAGSVHSETRGREALMSKEEMMLALEMQQQQQSTQMLNQNYTARANE